MENSISLTQVHSVHLLCPLFCIHNYLQLIFALVQVANCSVS